jgi:hypothetical protein
MVTDVMGIVPGVSEGTKAVMGSAILQIAAGQNTGRQTQINATILKRMLKDSGIDDAAPTKGSIMAFLNTHQGIAKQKLHYAQYELNTGGSMAADATSNPALFVNYVDDKIGIENLSPAEISMYNAAQLRLNTSNAKPAKVNESAAITAASADAERMNAARSRVKNGQIKSQPIGIFPNPR